MRRSARAISGVLVLAVTVAVNVLGNLGTDALREDGGAIGAFLAWQPWSTLIVFAIFALAWFAYWFALAPEASKASQFSADRGSLNIVNSHVVILEAPRPEPPPPPSGSPGTTPPSSPPPDAPFAIVTEDGELRMPNVIRNHEFRLTQIPLGANSVRGQAFEDCVIHGPALILPAGSNVFEECHWEAVGSIESILWERREGESIVGALILHECTFCRCTFRDIGIVGTANALARFRASLDPEADIQKNP